MGDCFLQFKCQDVDDGFAARMQWKKIDSCQHECNYTSESHKAQNAQNQSTISMATSPHNIFFLFTTSSMNHHEKGDPYWICPSQHHTTCRRSGRSWKMKTLSQIVKNVKSWGCNDLGFHGNLDTKVQRTDFDRTYLRVSLDSLYFMHFLGGKTADIANILHPP